MQKRLSRKQDAGSRVEKREWPLHAQKCGETRRRVAECTRPQAEGNGAGKYTFDLYSFRNFFIISSKRSVIAVLLDMHSNE